VAAQVGADGRAACPYKGPAAGWFHDRLRRYPLGVGPHRRPHFRITERPLLDQLRRNRLSRAKCRTAGPRNAHRAAACGADTRPLKWRLPANHAIV
jgi:hypothetical protein